MGDCDQFALGSASRARCLGESDWTIAKTNRWRASLGIPPIEGVEESAASGSQIAVSARITPRMVAKSKGGCCGGKKATVVLPRRTVDGTGVGGRLKEIFAAVGAPHCDLCQQLENQMDQWGPEECRNRIEEIVADILPRALAWESQKLGWFSRLIPTAVTSESIRLIVENAIETAKPLEWAEELPKPSVVFKPQHKPRTIQQKQITERPRRFISSSNYVTSQSERTGPFTSMFVTNGIGDVITISCYLKVNPEIKTIYYATRKFEYVKEYLSLLCQPDTEHINVWADQDNRFAWFSLREFRNGNPHKDFPDTIDWSIFQVFPRGLPFLGLPFTKEQIKDRVRDFGLPNRYAVFAPFTTDKRDSRRDLTREEIKSVLVTCHEKGLPVVLINNGNDPIIEAPGLTNLQNKTTLYESIYITMNSSMFIGTCSSMSVVATKTLPADRLLVRSFSNNLNRWKKAYYAPHEKFEFITTDLESRLKELKWTE